ncbi:MAG TPA: CHAT domain-containing tetratricopeptide repeat protein [Thermodesulfobacteriota bacterium]|nr:CHAT domain-containing tetratricopeptide repeat protein [Thermodesulfobacteriota bacterium]
MVHATCLNNLAGLYRAMGKYAAAEPLLKRALEIKRKLPDPGGASLSISLNDLGVLYHVTGNYAAAEPLMKEALEIKRKTPGENSATYASSLNNLGMLYKGEGDYAAAERLLRRALEIRGKTLGDSHPLYAQSLSNLGEFYRETGDYAAAERLYRRALEILRQDRLDDSPDFALSLNNLALVYKETGKYTAAEPLFRRALEIRRETLGEQHPEYAQALDNLGTLYWAQGKYGEAKPLLREAHERIEKALGETHPDRAKSLNSLAVFCFSTGDYESAEPLLRQAPEITRKAFGEGHPYYAAGLQNLAVLCAATGRESEALRLMQEAAGVADGVMGQVFCIGSESLRMAYMATLRNSLCSLLSLLLDSFPDSREGARTGLDLVLHRKAIGAEALAAQRDAVLGGRYPALQARLQALLTWRRRIAEKTLSGPGPEGPEAHRKMLAAWTDEKERLEEELAREIPEMNLEKKLRVADRKALARALPAGAALVEFLRVDVVDFKAVPGKGESQWKPARYLAFVLPAGEPDNVTMVDLGEAEPLERLIRRFRTSVDGGERNLIPAPRQRPGEAEKGAELQRALFGPLLPALGTRRRIILAPDGDLTRLPFEVLPTGGDRRLVDDYHLSYVAVGRDLLRPGASVPRERAVSLVIADPDFDLGVTGAPGPATPGRQSRALDRALCFNPLPGTRAEGEHVAARLGVRPHCGDGALKARLRSIPPPRILHIATHGFFLEDQTPDLETAQAGLGRLSHALENPLLRSGLALAGANTWLRNKPLPPEAEDGLLTAADVSGLDLLGTELVVLSACDTGLGTVQIGEGVLGLGRAFVLAGAKTLVMSLWKVPDRQTQEFMDDFYRRLLSGEGRADALRGAQLAMKERYPDTLHWGAFVCFGDPAPLS